MNNVSLVGRLTQAPELKNVTADKVFTKFNLAVDRYLGSVQKDEKRNEGKPTADFPRITVWGKPAENCCKYLDKGALVSVIGRVATNRFEKEDGEVVYMTEIVADRVHFLEYPHEDAE